VQLNNPRLPETWPLMWFMCTVQHKYDSNHFDSGNS